MTRILLPVDRVDQSNVGLERVCAQLPHYREPLEIHLLNVQRALSEDVGRFVGGSQVTDFHRDEGMKILAPAKEYLAGRGWSSQVHLGLGDPGEIILAFARDLDVQQIVMAASGRGRIAGLLLGSVVDDVLHHSEVPVLVVRLR